MKPMTATECRRRMLIGQKQFEKDLSSILEKLQEQFVQPAVELGMKRLLEIMKTEEDKHGKRDK